MIFPRRVISGKKDIADFFKTGLNDFKDKNVLLLISNSVQKQGLDKSLTGKLKQLSNLYLYKSGGEPDVENVNQIYSLYKPKKISVVIALGGGSIIDLAKAVSVCLSIDKNCGQVLKDKESIRRKVLLVVFPTTIGSGSEGTSISVITEGGAKKAIVDSCLSPDIVVLNPLFVNYLPKKVKIYNLIDACAQGIEALLSKKSSDFTDFYAKSSLDILLKYYPSYLNLKQNNPGLNQKMQIAVMNIGFAFSQAGTHLIHSFAYALAKQDRSLSHGRSIALVLAPILKFLLVQKKESWPRIKEYSPYIRKMIVFAEKYQSAIYSSRFSVFGKERVVNDVCSNRRLMSNIPINLNRKELNIINDLIYEKAQIH